MTANRKFKKTVRKYASEHGVGYEKARRALAQPKTVNPLSGHGLTLDSLRAIQRLIGSTGITVLAGPVGSGKTTLAGAIAADAPGIVVFDEVRDTETADAALSAADAGKTVLAVVNDRDAHMAMERLNALATDGDRFHDTIVGTITLRMLRGADGVGIPVAGVEERLTGYSRSWESDWRAQVIREVFNGSSASIEASLETRRKFGRPLLAQPIHQPLVALADLGFTEKALAGIRELIAQPEGIMIIPGPIGSGRSTLLHAAAAECRPGTAVLDEIITGEDIQRVVGAAQLGRKVLVGIHASSAGEAIREFQTLTLPPLDTVALDMITGVIEVRMVETIDGKLTPAAGIWVNGKQIHELRQDLDTLVASGVVDRKAADRVRPQASGGARA